MLPYYNPIDPACKSVVGGVEQNQAVVFRIFADGFQTCEFFLVNERTGETRSFRMQKEERSFSFCLEPKEIGLYWYRFSLDGKFFGESNNGLGAFGAESFLLLVYRKGFTTPEWIKGKIMYQIFPDRFYRTGTGSCDGKKVLREDWGGTPCYLPNEQGEVLNNDFFGGNLRGITEKLPYLAELNISAIYLNPIFKAYSNHRYDTGNYLEIDPLLGTREEFDQLIREAARFGIRVILDGVFNHTGADSLYFNRYGNYSSTGAYQSQESPYFNWYEFARFPDLYSSWWGFLSLPSIRKDSASFQNFIAGEGGVLENYSNVGGWRLDVADELSSDFIRHIRDKIKQKNTDVFLIGEVWEDAAVKIAYDERKPYFCGEELDSVMNYPLRTAILSFLRQGDAQVLAVTMRRLVDHYPKACLDALMNILDTHDTERILTALNDSNSVYEKTDVAEYHMSIKERADAREKLKIATLLQFTLPGIPCIYYGDEIGMEGYRDPFNRRCFDWDCSDEAIYSWYRKMAQIRSRISIFKNGVYREIYSDRNCIVFERRNNDRAVIIAVNRGNRKYALKFDGTLYDLLSERRFDKQCELLPKEAILLYDEVL